MSNSFMHKKRSTGYMGALTLLVIMVMLTMYSCAFRLDVPRRDAEMDRCADQLRGAAHKSALDQLGN